MEIKRGDIFYANLNKTSKTIGGKRPVIILQNNIANKYSPTVIVAPLSSGVSNHKIPTQVKINSIESGLKSDSIILLEQITTIEKERLENKISNVNESLMTKITKALKLSLEGFDAANDNILYKETESQVLQERDKYKIEELYKKFYSVLENNAEGIKNLEDKFDDSNSTRNKIKNWIIGGIIGAIFGSILTLLL